MDWNNSNNTSDIRGFVNSRLHESSLNFLYNNYYDHHLIPGMNIVKQQLMMEQDTVVNIQEGIDNMVMNSIGCSNTNIQDMKKKRLKNEQLELLEMSFQEEIKLDPDRKMKLSRDLGLQPRQIAVWFQNRRARWKSKQLERLYDALKLEFDVVSKEKLKLQQEVMKLKSMVREEAARKQAEHSNGGRYTEASGGEETVVSTPIVATRHPSITTLQGHIINPHQIGGGGDQRNYYIPHNINNSNNVDEFNPSVASANYNHNNSGVIHQFPSFP